MGRAALGRSGLAFVLLYTKNRGKPSQLCEKKLSPPRSQRYLSSFRLTRSLCSMNCANLYRKGAFLVGVRFRAQFRDKPENTAGQ
jgi:hypothetical protein